MTLSLSLTRVDSDDALLVAVHDTHHTKKKSLRMNNLDGRDERQRGMNAGHPFQ